MTARNRHLIAGLVLLIGVAFVGVGIARGELQTILRKAINICLECIGIG